MTHLCYPLHVIIPFCFFTPFLNELYADGAVTDDAGMNDADSSVNRLGATAASSGLTLVLPSLKALKELNAKNKSSSPSPSLGGELTTTTPAKKNARPVKLKPLREVLTSLITKIKK